MKTKKIVISILFISLLLSIFIFSSQNGSKSESISDTFAIKVIDKASSLTNKRMSDTKKKQIVNKTRFIVRKSAHFVLYFSLGVLTLLVLTSNNIKKSLTFAIIFCVLFACSDEIHQLFSPGRTARILDVIIDSLGSIVGIIITAKFLNKLKIKKEVEANKR